MCRLPRLVAVLCCVFLLACSSLERPDAQARGEPLAPRSFRYADGGTSVYYTFTAGDPARTDTAVFFYGATGCPSWGSVMPGYVDCFDADARFFVLNKRFVVDGADGESPCGRDFDLANNPAQWSADYAQFIAAMVDVMSPKPKHVVLVGVSEGAWPAASVAARAPPVTHLVLIGSGAYTMRESLATLWKKGDAPLDVAAGWQEIATDPRSIDKSWFGNPYRWWSDVMDLDPLPDLLRLQIPIWVGAGELNQSDPVESVRALQRRFEDAGKRNLTVKIYPGADHRLSANGVSYRRAFFADFARMLRRP